MVNINLTLVVELALFLVFLWGVTKFILRPALSGIDEREEKIEREHGLAETIGHDAQALEAEYGQAIGQARLEAERVFREAHTRAIESHATRMADARRAVDERVLTARDEGRAFLAAQREQLLGEAPALADEMARRLGVKGGAR